MSDPKTPAAAATEAAEAVRVINHLTIGEDRRAEALPWPSDIASTLSSLAPAAHRLPQALEQLRARLDRIEAENPGKVYADDGDLPGNLDGARTWLANAAGLANALGQALDRAAGHIYRLGVND